MPQLLQPCERNPKGQRLIWKEPELRTFSINLELRLTFTCVSARRFLPGCTPSMLVQPVRVSGRAQGGCEVLKPVVSVAFLSLLFSLFFSIRYPSLTSCPTLTE